jgi:two-component system alkaline phosphatase synthesis response regulator PhoP
MSLSWWWRLDNSTVIWVVEDDISTQRIVAEHLKAHGFRPILFDTAEKAYAALRSQGPPALIILDMLLPGMSGVDLIRLIKQNKVWEKIPVVVVTVLSRDESLASESEGAAAFWMNKPFDANYLIQTVQKVLASVGHEGKLS